jgi:hypothetical protein
VANTHPRPFGEDRLETWCSANGRNRLSIWSGHSRRKKLVKSWIGLVSLPILQGGARSNGPMSTGEDIAEATAASVQRFEDQEGED